MPKLLPFGAPVPAWWDVFTFDDAPTITCPDCDRQSPELADFRAAAEWLDSHGCPV